MIQKKIRPSKHEHLWVSGFGGSGFSWYIVFLSNVVILNVLLCLMGSCLVQGPGGQLLRLNHYCHWGLLWQASGWHDYLGVYERFLVHLPLTSDLVECGVPQLDGPVKG